MWRTKYESKVLWISPLYLLWKRTRVRKWSTKFHAIFDIITQEFRFYYKKWTDIFMGRCHKPDSHNGQAWWKTVLSSCLSIVPVRFVNKPDRHDGLPKFDPKKFPEVPRGLHTTPWSFFGSNLGNPSCLSIMTVRFVTSSHKNVCPLLIVKSELLGYNDRRQLDKWQVASGLWVGGFTHRSQGIRVLDEALAS